jgi:hypothetical protein
MYATVPTAVPGLVNIGSMAWASIVAPADSAETPRA